MDNGLLAMKLKHVSEYVNVIIKGYQKMNININVTKSKLIINSTNSIIISMAQSLNDMLKISYQNEGTVEYLGVPHGYKKYVNHVMKSKITTVNQLIINNSLRIVLYIKEMQKNFIHNSSRHLSHLINNTIQDFIDYTII